MREEFVPEAHSQDLERSCSWRLPSLVFALSLGLLTRCDGLGPIDGEVANGGSSASSDGQIPPEMLVEGCRGKDCIPALAEPTTAPVSEVSFLEPESRVISVRVGGNQLAVPHNVLAWHEVVNLERGGEFVAITLCPLTGSSMTFHRSSIGNAEFGVSGLLFHDNLVLYDRRKEHSLWPQMMRRAGRGPATGTDLRMIPSVVMSWEGFHALHPDGRVVGSATGYDRNYEIYPYEATSTRNRVLGIPTGDSGGVALPFEELRTEKDARVVRLDRPDTDVVVFWNQRYEAAMAFEARIGDESVSFTLVGEGVRDVIRDVKTGSVWTVEGLAVEGPLSGTRLEAVPNAYVAFKEAWKTFQPRTRIWSNDE